MAHLSGTFSSPYAGTLIVIFNGVWVQGGVRDAGFRSGPSNMLLRAKVGPYYTQSIDMKLPSSVSAFSYPGNTTWAISTELVSSSTGGGVAIFGFQDLSLNFLLITR